MGRPQIRESVRGAARNQPPHNAAASFSDGKGPWNQQCRTSRRAEVTHYTPLPPNPPPPGPRPSPGEQTDFLSVSHGPSVHPETMKMRLPYLAIFGVCDHKARLFSKQSSSFRMPIRVACLLFAAAVVLASPDAQGKDRKGHQQKGGDKKAPQAQGKGAKAPHAKGKGAKAPHAKGGGKRAAGGNRTGTGAIRADVLAWILAHNKGLNANFLKTELPEKTIKLPSGQTVPIYKLKQFLEVNFRLTFFARKKEKGSDVVPVMEERLRKLMALPNFYHWIKDHRSQYRISPKGKVSAQEAYQHFRRINRHLGVTAGKQYHAPVGGGGGMAAPSWAVWRAMNLFEHEACHCIGIGHNSGGLSGPLAGALRTWDRKKLWMYQTIDLNTLAVPKT